MIREPEDATKEIQLHMQPKVHLVDYKRDVNEGVGPIKSQSLVFRMSLEEPEEE